MFRATGLLAMLLTSFATASAQVTVTGTLVGHDGKPMPSANVTLTTTMRDTSIKRVSADKDGKYSITIDSSGIWALWYTGANHSSHSVALYIDKPGEINIDVRLKTYNYVDTIREVKIDGDFNHFNMQAAVSMQKQPDGTFTAEFETKADSFAYEIVGITKDGHTINGTQSERYIYDGGGDYNSVVTPTNGKVRIIFDPAKLVRSDEPFKVTFDDPLSMEAKFAEIYDEETRDVADFNKTYSGYKKSGKDLKQFKYDWSKEIESIIGRLEKENDPILRQALYMNFLSLGLFQAKLDSSIAQKAIREIPPSSILWSLNPLIISPALQYFAGLSDEERDNYVQRVLDENPVVGVKAALLLDVFVRARLSHDNKKAATYYDMLVNKYGNTSYGKMAKERFSPAVNVAVGKPVLAFSIASLEDSTEVFTNESFKGKYYMIDFWATWCGPCVGEMDYLHKAYMRFKDKNFEILSVSLDGSPQDVVKFRRDKWQMSWLQAFAGAWDNKMVKDFEVIGIPHPVLVDTTGMIVAIDEDLRGENLEKTLEKFLGK